jgi:hypothetical protein
LYRQATRFVTGEVLMSRTCLASLSCLAFGLAGCGSKSDFAIGYEFSSSDNVKSLLIPQPLKGGQSKFELVVEGKTYPLDAGKRFFFTSDFPNGVNAFSIRGISLSEQLDSKNLNAFMIQPTFMFDGPAGSVKMVPITRKSWLSSGWVSGGLAVLVVGGLCFAGFLWWKKQNAD